MEIGMIVNHDGIPLDTAHTIHIMKILLMTIVIGIATTSLFAFPILSDSAFASIKIPDASGAMQPCLDSGYSYQYCKFILGSPDLGICGYLQDCPVQK